MRLTKKSKRGGRGKKRAIKKCSWSLQLLLYFEGEKEKMVDTNPEGKEEG